MSEKSKKPLFYISNLGEEQKRYRVVGLVMFLVAVGLLVMRLIAYIMPSSISDIAMDVIFSVPLQIGVLVVMPFLVYKFALKMRVREIFEFSNFRRTKWYNLVLAVPLAFCVFGLTIAISGVWQTILTMLGYTHGSSAPLPSVFNPWLLALNIFLTGVLPGFCEEFCNRGGFLTTMRKSYPFTVMLVIMGVEFGLFHQNITQVVYTMFFGAFTAFLTIKLKSVFPAMIVHFANNTISVLDEFCGAYGWLGGGLNGALNFALKYPLLIGIALGFALIFGVCITGLLVYLNSDKRKEMLLAKKAAKTISLGGEQASNITQANIVNQTNITQVNSVAAEPLFKPTLRDNAFYFGAAATAIFTTIATFIFGVIV